MNRSRLAAGQAWFLLPVCREGAEIEGEMVPAYVLVEGIEALPALPQAVASLSALVRNERATAAEFERVIRPDPTLTASLLRAANSAFHRGLSPIRTVREAMARIGLKRLCEVAFVAALRRMVPPRIPGYGLDGPAFWRHCTATALFAEALAAELGVGEPDAAFTAGLLHDIGKLVIGAFLAEEMPLADWESFGTAQAERELIGTDHCRVGEEISRRWRLPEAVLRGARCHHDPDAGSSGDLVAIVDAADGLAYAAGHPGGSHREPGSGVEAAGRLGLASARLDRLMERTAEGIRQMSAGVR